MSLTESTFYNISFTMSRTKSESSQQMKKQKHIKNRIHTINEDWHELIQMLQLADKGFKSANITMIKDLK